jgi:hypothetical protein
LPDSARTPQRHPKPVSDDQRATKSLKETGCDAKEKTMNNQHAGLSQILAEQRTSELQEQAAHAWLLRPARPPRRQRRRWVPRGWWRLAPSPGVAAEQPASHPQHTS